MKFSQILKKSPWEDFEEEENIFTKKRKRSHEPFNFDQFKFGDNKKLIYFLMIVAFLLWIASGFYKVKEGEQAVVTRFGAYNRIGLAGLNYHIPTPFESVIIEKVNQYRKVEIGYRSSAGSIRAGGASGRDVNSESIMLTGDENIVELNVYVMWYISDIKSYVFNILGQPETVKAVAESAIREVVGNTSIASILSDKKQEIAEEILKLTQKTLDLYVAGIKVDQVQLLKAEPPKEVIPAYRDVQISRADKEREINQAQSYHNDIIPRARGDAEKIIQDAEGYAADVIARAHGDTARFNLVYKQYVENKEVTKNRLYLEAIEQILRNTDKVIVGSEAMLPHMSMGEKNMFKK